jgi:hypothetical protein
MRVKSDRQSEKRHRGGPSRRGPLVRREPSASPAESEPAPPAEDDLFDERRLRASGGPSDRAQYACGCGFAWEDYVSASVSCPHCGAAQAW